MNIIDLEDFPAEVLGVCVHLGSGKVTTAREIVRDAMVAQAGREFAQTVRHYQKTHGVDTTEAQRLVRH